MVATSGWFYVDGTRRQWRLAPSLVALVLEANSRQPDRSTASDGSIGDADHQARDSDHNPHVLFDGVYWVTAVDLTDWDPRFDVDGWAEDCRRRKDPRIKYQISDGRFYSSYSTSTRAAWEWAPYTGPNGHFLHVHTSVRATRFGIYGSEPWFDTPSQTTTPTYEGDDMATVYKLKEGHVVLEAGKLLAVSDQDTLAAYKAAFPTVDLSKDAKGQQRLRKAFPMVTLP